MQKGHRRSPVLILLSALILSCLLFTGGARAKRYDRAVGPLLSLSGLGDSSSRPIIGREFPTLPAMMQTRQGSGPDPDLNLTPTAGATQELFPNASTGSTQNRIVFSSDGVDDDGDGRIDPDLPADPDLDLWIMRSDGSEQYQVADLAGDQVDPAYDPSGGLLAFAQEMNGTFQIFTIEVRNPAIITQITTGAGDKRHPTWSPDTNWIAFQTNVNGDWDIYKIAATGVGAIVPVTVGAPDDTDPAWRPNGLSIAFTRDNGTVKRVYTSDPSGGNIEAVTNGGGDATVNDQEPAWRGSEIAFASDRLTEAADTITNFNIWRVNAAGEPNGNVPTLVSNPSLTETTDSLNPAYTVNINRAPTRLLFVSDRAGNQPDIWAMQLRDWIPPVLNEVPTVTPRLAVPGDDVTISVPVYDRDSGVASVIAIVKDPDIKTFLRIEPASFDTSFTAGIRELELDCVPVSGPIILTDDDGDGVFTGDWTTQLTPNGRDYIVDIFVTDVAGNSVIYDDVSGFSTRTFEPSANILFVDDYCEGQSFLSDLGINNHFGASFPVESYFRRNPGTHPGIGNVDFDSISDSYGENYDVWRIICRGRIPPQVYQYYLPTIEYQIDPADAGNPDGLQLPATRAVPVAQRAVLWASPHTGDVWTAGGSLIDASTQSDIASFVQRGGRIMLTGEDVAWALTLAGTRANSFMTNVLHARYLSDISAFDFGIGGLAGDPVAFDPWGGGHYIDGSADTPLAMNSTYVSRPTTSPWFEDASEWSRRPDAIEVLAPAIRIFSINSGETTTFGEPAVGLRWEDTTGNRGKVIFLSFGFEQIHRSYHNTSSPPPHCANKRSHLIHNAMCWMRTGGFQGRVISVSDGGQAVNDPSPIVSAIQGGQVLFAVQCQEDGTYIMQGLPPGGYALQCTRPGYDIQHAEGELTHGGLLPPTQDFVIHRAQPGAVAGTVTSAATGDPLANVTVSIAVDPDFTGPPPPSLPDPVLTAADGTYTLPYIPPGDYVVTADGTAILYGTEDQDATVNPGDTTTVNFALDAADGVLEATVTDLETDDPIRNAAVAVVDSLGNRTTGFTDSTGLAVIALPPGDYTVTASASGYTASAPQNITITPAETVEVEFALQQEPGGSIAGRVVTAGTGAFIADVTVRVFFGDEEIASAQTSGGVVTTINGVQYNYKIDDVPTGEVRVIAERAGFSATPAERTVLIQSNKTTRDVNFAMDSLRTFPRGLQLVSFPWDYSTIDPKVLLGISGTFRMATWEATRQRYALYPEAPADRFRIGVGYWMNLSDPADLSQEGANATDPVELPLAGGWNLIGDPYNARIDFYTAKVRDVNNVVLTLQEALSQGIIGSSLYAYVLGGYQTVGVLSPYTGYWLKTNMPCSLILSEDTGALAAGGRERDVTPRVNNGWLMQLKTSVSGVQDTATYMGWSRDATDGCDFALDEYKPPVPAMGPYVYTAIDNRAWENGAGDYAVDVRPKDVPTTWDLTVYTNQVGERVVLAWDDMSRLPNSVRPVLVDVATGRKVYMRTSHAFTFKATDQPRRLQVMVSPAGVGQLAITPQAAAQTGGGVAISYTLSRAANVDVVIANIAGRAIRRLGNGELQSAGLNTLLWDGRDNAGLQTPAGRYLVTVIGRTESGQECRAVMPLERRAR